jgi:hypothetical protein
VIPIARAPATTSAPRDVGHRDDDAGALLHLLILALKYAGAAKDVVVNTSADVATVDASADMLCRACEAGFAWFLRLPTDEDDRAAAEEAQHLVRSVRR